MNLSSNLPHSLNNWRPGASEMRAVSVAPGQMAITLTPVLSKWYGN
jgi:hypothetical protein